MIKSGIDQEALINLFSSATAKQGDAVRDAVRDLTLKALQGRELTLQNIRKVLKQVTESASMGAMKNVAGPVDVEALLENAVAGMDDALLKAVEANRVALQRFVDQGVTLQETHLKKALDDLEKFEDVMIKTISKASGSVGGQIQGPWQQVLSQMKMDGTGTGMQAAKTVEALGAQMQSAMRDSRAIGMRAAQALAQSYATLVSGVLIGMSEGLQGGRGATKARKK